MRKAPFRNEFHKLTIPTTPGPTRAGEEALAFPNEIAKRNALNIYRKIVTAEKRPPTSARHKEWGKKTNDWTVITFGLQNKSLTPLARNKDPKCGYSRAATPKGIRACQSTKNATAAVLPNKKLSDILKSCIESVLKRKISPLSPNESQTPSRCSDSAAVQKRKRRSKAERSANKLGTTLQENDIKC